MVSGTVQESNGKVNWKALALVLILAACFRLWGTFEFSGHIEDEAIHVANAVSLGQYGTTDRLNWQHPHLSGLILACAITLLGDNPHGWRSSNIFFGTASVVLVFLIGALLYPGSAVPILASFLLALDPFHIYFSRITYMEIPASFFFLLYLYLMLEYVENHSPALPFAGIALGLTIATKAYFIFAIPLVCGYALLQLWQQRRLTRSVAIDFIITLFLLPMAVYLLSYFKWFGRGYSLPDFFQMKLDAVYAMQRFNAEGFVNRAFLEAGGQPWEWFLKPLVVGHQILSDGIKGRFLLHINNFPFGLMTIPSMLLISMYALKKRAVQELFVPLLFFSCYLLFLVLQRPIFSYSAVVLLPFAYLSVARAIVLFAQWSGRSKYVYGVLLCSIVVWGFYTFPLVSARLVSLSLYKPILSIAKIVGLF